MTSNTITAAACVVAFVCDQAVKADAIPWTVGVVLVMVSFFVAAKYYTKRMGGRHDGK